MEVKTLKKAEIFTEDEKIIVNYTIEVGSHFYSEFYSTKTISESKAFVGTHRNAKARKFLIKVLGEE